MMEEPPYPRSTVLSLPLRPRVGAGCCPRRGPSHSRAGLIKLIGRGDICGGERLVWLSAQGVEVLGGRRGWGRGWGVLLPRRLRPRQAGAQPGALCPRGSEPTQWRGVEAASCC